MTHPLAAWTPDAPDAGTAPSPSALIAAGEPPFDPETLDHFDGITVCGARVAFVIAPNTTQGGVWQRIEMTCGEDDGHHPDTPHRAEYSWGDTVTLPAEPDCPQCADVGVTLQGEPCICVAGDKFEAAARLLAEVRDPA
jgi:hypothetical protein